MFGLQSWLNSSWTMLLKAMKSGWIFELFYWFPDVEVTIYFLRREKFQDMLVALDPTDTNPEVTIEDFQSALKFCINKLTSKTEDSSFLFNISSINNNPQSTQHHSKLSSNHDSKTLVQCSVISGWSFIIIYFFFYLADSRNSSSTESQWLAYNLKKFVLITIIKLSFNHSMFI
jgi:hypothetical protein